MDDVIIDSKQKISIPVKVSWMLWMGVELSPSCHALRTLSRVVIEEEHAMISQTSMGLREMGILPSSGHRDRAELFVFEMVKGSRIGSDRQEIMESRASGWIHVSQVFVVRDSISHLNHSCLKHRFTRAAIAILDEMAWIG